MARSKFDARWIRTNNLHASSAQVRRMLESKLVSIGLQRIAKKEPVSKKERIFGEKIHIEERKIKEIILTFSRLKNAKFKIKHSNVFSSTQVFKCE